MVLDLQREDRQQLARRDTLLMVQRVRLPRPPAYTPLLLLGTGSEGTCCSLLPLDAPLCSPRHRHGLLQTRFQFNQRPSTEIQGEEWVRGPHERGQVHLADRLFDSGSHSRLNTYADLRPDRHTISNVQSVGTLGPWSLLWIKWDTRRWTPFRVRIAGDEEPLPHTASIPDRSCIITTTTTTVLFNKG